MTKILFNYTFDNVKQGDLLRFNIHQQGTTFQTVNHVVTPEDARGDMGTNEIELNKVINEGDEAVGVYVEINLNGQWQDHALTQNKEPLDPEVPNAVFFDGYQIGVQ